MKSSECLALLIAGTLFLSNMVFAQELTYIAVHVGNPEYASVINQNEYPDFHFYTTNGDHIYIYSEQAPLVSGLSKPRFMDGYYGEIPEKLGFSPNYQIGMPVLAVGANGVIAGLAEGSFHGFLMGDTDLGKLNSNLRKAVKNMQKGKYEKLLAENKRHYLKSTPIGELEPVRRAKIDKKKKGLIGWELPGITVYDSEGNPHALNKISHGENRIIIFYSMNAVTTKIGSRKDGSIIEVIVPEMPERTSARFTGYQSGKAPLDFAKYNKDKVF